VPKATWTVEAAETATPSATATIPSLPTEAVTPLAPPYASRLSFWSWQTLAFVLLVAVLLAVVTLLVTIAVRLIRR
jgi:hypothetical protein